MELQWCQCQNNVPFLLKWLLDVPPLTVHLLVTTSTPHLKEWSDPSLGAAVLVGIKLQQETCHPTVALPAGHEEGALSVVVGCFHVSTHFQEELSHPHMALSVGDTCLYVLY